MPIKVWLPLLIILGAISWLAFSNLNKANYFYTVDQLPELSDQVYRHDVKVKGRIVVGSIKDEHPVVFTIHENDKELVVRYVGEEPLPDLFKDRAETVVHGRMGADGIFNAIQLQAKCASKYEAEGPGDNSSDYQTLPETSKKPDSYN